MDAGLVAAFELVCDKIAGHASYSLALAEAVAAGERLILNYHTHGADQAYCVSVCVERSVGGEPPALAELAHITGLGGARADCGPRMAVFAARLVERYGLEQAPLVYLDGAPFTPP